MNRLHVIGCGGVGGWVVTLLSRMADLIPPFSTRVTLWDGDTVESRNLSRQLFEHEDVSRHKAEVLAERVRYLLPCDVKTEFFCERDTVDTGDTVLMGVDNHAARRNVLAAVDSAGPGTLVIGMANELTDVEAWVYYPEWKDTDRDPRRYIANIDVDEPPEQDNSCAAVGQQSAFANMGAAWLGVHLWHLHRLWQPSTNVDRDVLVWRHRCSALRIGLPA